MKKIGKLINTYGELSAAEKIQVARETKRGRWGAAEVLIQGGLKEIHQRQGSGKCRWTKRAAPLQAHKPARPQRSAEVEDEASIATGAGSQGTVKILALTNRKNWKSTYPVIQLCPRPGYLPEGLQVNASQRPLNVSANCNLIIHNRYVIEAYIFFFLVGPRIYIDKIINICMIWK